MGKKIKFDELSFGTKFMIAFTFFIVMCVLIFSISTLIFEEKKRNAYWECHDETFEGIINKTEVGFCYMRDSKIWYCNYDGYESKCPYDSDLCYVDDTKEVCIVK